MSSHSLLGHGWRALWRGRSQCSPPYPVGESGIVGITNGIVDFFAGRDARGLILIDAGMDTGGIALDRLLTSLDARIEDVHLVLLTHGHPDHVAAAPLLTRARVFGGARDRARFAGRHRGRLAERLFRRVLPTPNISVTDWLDGECEIAIAGEPPIRAWPTPGDTPGAYSFLWRGVLFVGDALDWRQGRLEPALGFATDDASENRRSIIRLANRVDELDLHGIAVSHGGLVPGGEAKRLLRDLSARLRAR